MPEPEPLQQVDRTYVRYKNRRLSYFAGCDYFRLSSHPKVLRALEEGLHKYGLNVAASRMTTGNHLVYGGLEKALAGFFRAPAALVISNGYNTNLAVAQALQNDFSVALLDSKAHVSLRDAAKFLACPVVEFEHGNPSALAHIGKKARPILLTDGMYAQDGGIAPLREYLKILPRDGLILVDDAHGAGVIGRTGKGTPEYEGVARDRIVQTVTLSKAFGVYGGAILCKRELREKIIASSRMFAGSTPLPLPLACAAETAVNLLRADTTLRRRLNHNTTLIKDNLRARGVSVLDTPSPVISVVPKNKKEAEAIQQRMLARNVFPSFIRYPGGPKDGYFRIVISSEHTPRQLNDLLEALANL